MLEDTVMGLAETLQPLSGVAPADEAACPLPGHKAFSEDPRKASKFSKEILGRLGSLGELGGAWGAWRACGAWGAWGELGGAWGSLGSLGGASFGNGLGLQLRWF